MPVSTPPVDCRRAEKRSLTWASESTKEVRARSSFFTRLSILTSLVQASIESGTASCLRCPPATLIAGNMRRSRSSSSTWHVHHSLHFALCQEVQDTSNLSSALRKAEDCLLMSASQNPACLYCCRTTCPQDTCAGTERAAVQPVPDLDVTEHDDTSKIQQLSDVAWVPDSTIPQPVWRPGHVHLQHTIFHTTVVCRPEVILYEAHEAPVLIPSIVTFLIPVLSVVCPIRSGMSLPSAVAPKHCCYSQKAAELCAKRLVLVSRRLEVQLPRHQAYARLPALWGSGFWTSLCASALVQD